MSKGDGSVGFVGNIPIGPPIQRNPRSQQHVNPRGYLSGQYPCSVTPGQRFTYPGSGSMPLPGLVVGPRLTVVGMPQ